MEQQISAIEILSLLETSKEQRQTFVASVMNDIKDGAKNPLDIHLQVKCMEDLAANLKDDPEYKKYLLEETVKLCGGAKFAGYRNAKFEVKEVGAKYDYLLCNDDVLNDLILKSEAANKRLKDRQEFLKKITSGGIEVLNSDTGEVAKIYPPSKTSTTSVAVTLK